MLLTYNLTALYSYNVRERDTPVWSIAWHRFLSVSVGVIYTLIVSRYWWPYEARRVSVETTRISLSRVSLTLSASA